ncbi:MAG: hypothetical protein ABIO63_05840 [Casimicrobiaceae bacterium]
MPTARELLEQADALMRRNRADANDDIPVLTEAVPAVDLPSAFRTRVPAAVEGPDSVPLLTDSIDVVEVEDEDATVGRETIEGEPSAWLEFADGETSVIGDAPDSIAIVPPVRLRSPSEEVLLPSAELEEIELTLPREDTSGDVAATAAEALAREVDAGQAAAREAAAVEQAAREAAQREVAEREIAEREAAEREVAEREIAEREAAQREVAEREISEREAAERERAEREMAAREAAAREVAAREAAEYEAAARAQAEREAAARDVAAREAAETEAAARALAEREVAEREAAARDVALQEAAAREMAELEAATRPTAGPFAVVAQDSASIAAIAGEAPAPASLSMADDDERWVAAAEEIRMQVLQRIDLFTDTGLRDQLAERLQPIADRASADFVAAINLHVGDLLRSYVAEAIEREIELWRRDH